MSVKKAKEERKDEAEARPDLIAGMTIKMFKNGQVFVEGIPQDFDVAMTAITTACKAVAGAMVDQVKQDDKKIITPPSTGLILPSEPKLN